MNYSKWDHLDLDDSDEEEEGERRRERDHAPRVTVFADRQRVNIGPAGAHFSNESEETKAISASASSSSSSSLSSTTAAAASKTQLSVPPSSTVQADHSGLIADTSTANMASTPPNPCCEFVRNGAFDAGYHWSQTGNEVLLYYDIPADLRAKNIEVSVASRVEVAGLRGPWISISNRVADAQDSVILPFKQLLYDVHLDQDIALGPRVDAGPRMFKGCPVDWEIVRHGMRKTHILITLRKKPPVAGAVVWWKTVFFGEGKEVDVTTIEGRAKGGPAKGLSEAWGEAHRKFVEQVKQKQEASSNDADYTQGTDAVADT